MVRGCRAGAVKTRLRPAPGLELGLSMQWSKPDHRQARNNRLISLGHGLGVPGEGWRLDEGAHAGFKLGSQGEEHHRKNVTLLVRWVSSILFAIPFFPPALHQLPLICPLKGSGLLQQIVAFSL